MSVKKSVLSSVILSLFVFYLPAQDNADFHSLHFRSSHTSFPDTGRANGHLYDSILYTASAHYQDSSVLLIIPKHLIRTEKVDLVFWFHGWRNNIDTAAEFYELTKQFIASNRNAVLVLAETARDAPDSYGGKLERPGEFRGLVYDVMHALKQNGFIPGRAEPARIVLAGHSGAFRVIAYILQNGEIPVQEVLLFDALYSQVDKFLSWLNKDPSHHFVHWFTNQGGGTDEVSYQMMQLLKDNRTNYMLTEENGVTPDIIKNNRILFVHSLREHNVIIMNPDNFQLLLENSFTLLPN